MRRSGLAAGILLGGCLLLLLATTGYASHDVGISSRTLLQSSTTIEEYLVPTREGELTSAGDCDAVADQSPHYLELLTSKTSVVDGNPYTTFFMRLMRDGQQACAGGCCDMAVTKIWVDVDPSLKIVYASFGGATTGFDAVQDEHGYHVTPTEGLLSLPDEGMLVTITVKGSNSVDLCPVPDYAIGSPVRGLCGVILSGAATGTSCCPMSIARLLEPSEDVPPIVPIAPACSADPSNARYQLDLFSAASFQAPSGRTMTNYSFVVHERSECDASAINSCCDMTLDALTLSIVAGANVVGAYVHGHRHTDISFAPGDTNGFTSLTLASLGLSDVAPAGSDIVITVEGEADLCRAGVAADGTVGECAYTMSAHAMCCPTGETGTVQPGAEAACAPDTQVALEDTTMGFNFYDSQTVGDATVFQFKVTNFEGCGADSCLLCSWQLFVDPSLVSSGLVSFDADENGDVSVDASTGAATFTRTPGPSASHIYTVTVSKPDFELQALCQASAVPGQAKDCGAVLRSPAVWAPVSFDAGDAVGSPAPPMPEPPVPACESPRPLGDACVLVEAAGWVANEHGVSMEFRVQNHEGTVPGCTADDDIMSFELLLQPAVVDVLQARGYYTPSYVEWPNAGNAIVWQFTPVANGSPIHYQVWVLDPDSNPSEMCLQNAVPNQPRGTCAVVFSGSEQCFSGYVPVPYDASLPGPSVGDTDPSGGTSTAVVVPVVVVLLVVVAACIAAFVVYRRRRRARAGGKYATDGSTDGALVQPLDGGGRSSDAGSATEASGLFGSRRA